MSEGLEKGDLVNRPWVPFVLAISLFVVYSCFHQSRDWNSASRLLLTYSLAQSGSIEITPFVARDGKLLVDPPTRDLSSPGDGRYYCDKAPGQSFLGVPACWLALKAGLIEPYPTGVAARAYWPSDYWVTLGTNGLYTALSAVVIFGLLRRLGNSTLASLLAAQAWGIGCIALPYATLYYGHSTCAFFTILSVYLLVAGNGGFLPVFMAGTCAGIAVTIDYPQVVFAGLATLVVLVSGVFFRSSPFARWSWLAFSLGGLPVALLLGYYHYLVTGSAFRVPYTMEVEEMFAYHRVGMGIPIGVPKLAVVWELFVGEKRGLLWYSPVVFAAVPGLIVMSVRRQWWLTVLVAGTFLGLLGINAGFPTWDGGWAVGPRFLLPSFPLLLLAAGFWLGSVPKNRWVRVGQNFLKAGWIVVLAASSVLLTGFTAVGGRVPPHFERPINEFLFPMLSQVPQSPLGLTWLAANTVGPLSGSNMLGWFVVTIIVVSQTLLFWGATARPVFSARAQGIRATEKHGKTRN